MQRLTCKPQYLSASALMAACIILSATAQAGDQPTPDIALADCSVAAHAMGLRYQQQSAEVRALQRQSWALATYRLKDILEKPHEGKSLAIITDLDETVIDNSALLVRDFKACHDYTSWDTWGDWEKEGKPTLIPGAKAFLDYASDHDVTIYYISDRLEENHSYTMETLKALGLPQVDKEHVLLLGPPKQARRASVEKDHQVIMQLGDTLHDFSEDFAKRSLSDEYQAVEDNAERFGSDWIVLPNTTYGNWSDATLEGWDKPLKP